MQYLNNRNAFFGDSYLVDVNNYILVLDITLYVHVQTYHLQCMFMHSLYPVKRGGGRNLYLLKIKSYPSQTVACHLYIFQILIPK